LLFNNGMV